MFITLTIDTTRKNKSKLRMNKTQMNPAKGWRKAVHLKKRSLAQKYNDWRRSLRDKKYFLDGQVAMF